MFRRLKTLGILPRPIRSASLMDLVTELLAIVFSRLLGFSEQTAANWTAESGGEDAPYAAHRASRAAAAHPMSRGGMRMRLDQRLRTAVGLRRCRPSACVVVCTRVIRERVDRPWR